MARTGARLVTPALDFKIAPANGGRIFGVTEGDSMRRVLAIAAAAVFLVFSAGPSFALKKTGAPTLTMSDYVGTWSGAIDWRGVEGYDNPTARWDLRADGSFIDDYGSAGSWTIGPDGYLSLQYNEAGQARYTGVIMGNLLFGTMVTADGQYTGVFAMRR